MQLLTQRELSILARVRAVDKVMIKPVGPNDADGWFVEVIHRDPKLSRQVYCKRGQLRVFKSVGPALNFLIDCDFDDDAYVHMRHQVIDALEDTQA
jgi:hypothetical protein